MTLHVYSAGWQRATRYRVTGMPGYFKHGPHTLVWCSCCKRRRVARNVEVQVYYDLTRARCVAGKGCR